ncbi:zinc finger protein 436-like isoform X1 [Micropterus dolomieu]|uniref:zinc finger protein 436-like isoform X1 n=1 Tax=Micropterus dolomieu TaxID=147949 RepID=UPI001E8EE330|nr:zinc finger protein 436-like isoform X1 [Micropterus dolomieu]
MSKIQMLRGFINQRLTAAAEEIFGLFERTISEYEEELCRSKEENQRHRKLLDAVFQPEVRLHRADVQQLLVSKEEVLPEQQQWSPRLDQEDPPELPHIKGEQEERWNSQEGEQLPGLEEAEITKFPFTPVPVKSEEDGEEKPQSSQLHQSQTEEDIDAEHLETETAGEDCGGPEPARNFNQDSPLQLYTHDNTSLSPGPETDDSCDWEETREPQPGLNPLQNNEVPVSDQECNTGETSVSSSECAARFGNKGHLQNHNGTQTDVQQLLVSKEEVLPEHQLLWSPKLDQEDPPEMPRVKEEQEELWTSQEGEQLPGLEEADITKFPFTPVPVKTEEDGEEKPQSSKLHQSQTEGPEPARNFNPDSPLQPGTDDQTSLSSESETDDSCDWEETREPQPGLNPLQNNEVPVSDQECNTGETSVSSSECAARFGHKEHLQNHNGTQTGVKPFICSVCGKRFTRKTHLRQHSKVHTGEKPFSCSVCGKRFTRKAHLRQHSTVHTGEKPFSCSVCGKRFTEKGTLRQHSKVHTGEKPFSCSVCGKRFTQKGTLRRHSTVHTGERPFSCAVCGKRFTRKAHLRLHSTVHTGEKPFSCSVCGKRFTEKGTLRQHSKVHTGEKPFSCLVCGKRFIQKAHLGLHSKVHTGERPFSCSVCGKRFTEKGNLRRHFKVHTGEKPFSCSVCGKRFTQKGTLRRHSEVHTGEKPFSCSICGKRFTQKAHLGRHSPVHTGEKPFSCSVCGKRFTQKGTLRQHSKVHTGEKPFSCSICGERFIRKGILRQHSKVHM